LIYAVLESFQNRDFIQVRAAKTGQDMLAPLVDIVNYFLPIGLGINLDFMGPEKSFHKLGRCNVWDTYYNAMYSFCSVPNRPLTLFTPAYRCIDKYSLPQKFE
jgi:hypothetical protein